MTLPASYRFDEDTVEEYRRDALDEARAAFEEGYDPDDDDREPMTDETFDAMDEHYTNEVA